MKAISSQPHTRVDPAPDPPSAENSRKSEQAAQGPAEFLWVDYRDGSAQSQMASRTRQAFIRSRHHRLRKENQIQRLKDSIRPFPSNGPTQSSVVDPGPVPSADQENNSDDFETNDAWLDVPKLHDSLDTGLVEAFPSLAIATDTGINLYFTNYRVHTSKACFPLCSADMTTWLCRRAMEQPAVVQVMLTTSASSRAVKLSIAGASTKIVHKALQDALRLRSELIKSIQKMLQRSSETNGDTMILVVGLLLCIEGAEGNKKAVTAHADGLKKIVRALGGMDNLSHNALSILYCCDLFRGLVANLPPIFEITPGWMSDLRDKSVFLNTDEYGEPTIGCGFFSSSWSGEIHPQLRLILRSLQKLIPCYENEVYAHSKSIPVANDCLLLLTHRLLSLSFDFPLTPFQELLRLSVLLYVAVRIWTFQGKGCTEYFLQFVRDAIDKTHNSLVNTAMDLLFWIYFLSGFASKGLECHSWCISRLIQCADALSVDSWESALVILKRFLFVSRMTDEAMKEFWTTVRYSRKVAAVRRDRCLATIPKKVTSIAIVDVRNLSRIS